MTVNLTHAECTRRGEALSVQDSRVELDLSAAADASVTAYRSRTTITFAATCEQTWVDLLADRVVSATLNGRPLDVEAYDGARLPLTGLASDNEVVVEADCRYSRTGEGLHRFTDPQDQGTYLYTHFEPTDSRRMFACFEQPDLKARFTFVVTAPAAWTVLSGQAEESRTESGETVTVTFAPTPRQSSYITAVAAGPYHAVCDTWSTQRADGSTQQVDLRVLCRRSMAPYLEPEELLDTTKRGLDYFDRAFAFPYPWGKYDQIFVPEYNLGAMENPGLVTFTDSMLIRGKATQTQREMRAEVTMHEMCHMWFGDLATPKWWDDLWLKESFADLMGYQTADEATPFEGSWVSFALGRKQWAYTQDERPSTHPIVATIDDLEAARQNFDGITYAKGAAVLKQLQAYVGREAFFEGARRYFAEHAYGSTTLADLLRALEASSGRDLGEWSRLWLQTAGPSVLTPTAEHDSDGRITRLSIAQEATDAVTGEQISRPHQLGIGLYRLADGRLQRTRLLDTEVRDGATEVPEAVGEAADLVLVNDGDHTYAVVRLDERSVQVARDHLGTLTDPLSRALVWSSLWNMVRHGLLTAPDFLETVVTQTAAETDPTLLQHTLSLAHTGVCAYTPPELRSDLADRLAVTALERLRAASPGGDTQLVWARALARAGALTGAVAPQLRELLDTTLVVDGLPMDPDLRWDLATALSAQGVRDEKELDADLELDSTMNGRIAHERAMASRPGVPVKRQVWRTLAEDPSLTNDRQRALLAGFGQPASAPDTAGFTDTYFASLTDWWATMPQTMATRLVIGLFPAADLPEPAGLEDAAGRSPGASGAPQSSPDSHGSPQTSPEEHPVIRAASAWLQEHPDAEAALRRTVVEQRHDTLRALRCQARART